MAVRVAGVLMVASAFLLGVWAVATLSKFGQFSASAHAIFDDVAADLDVVSLLDLAFVAGAVLSLILACALLVVAVGVYRSFNWARIGFGISCLVALPLLWLCHIRNAPYIMADGTGPAPAVTRLAMAKVDELTPWRFSGWYHHITLGFGIAVAVFLVVGLALLFSPSSNRHFRT